MARVRVAQNYHRNCLIAYHPGLRPVFRRYFETPAMPKAYWISNYRKILDADKLAAYAKLAGPAIEAGGGRFLARSTASRAYEDGVVERTVLIEFDSVERAVATHESPAYREALAALEGGVVRDLRIVAGV